MSESPTTTNDVLLDDPEAGSTWFISVVSMVLLVVTILALIAIYFDFADGEVDRKVIDQPVVDLQRLKLSQQETLTEYGTYNVENADGDEVQRVRIPIDRAMDLVIKEGNATPPAEPEGTLAGR